MNYKIPRRPYSFFPMPLTTLDHFGEQDLNPDEVIIYRTRMHFFAFIAVSFRSWVITFFGIFIILVAYLFRGSIGFFIDPTITVGIFLFAGIFLVLGGYQLFKRLLDFFYDESIITNQRVVVENQESLFSEGVVTASMRSIEEVQVIQQGIWRTFLNYGSLQVKTAARSGADIPGQESLTLFEIPKPEQVQKLIDEIAYRVKKEVKVVPEEVLKACGL